MALANNRRHLGPLLLGLLMTLGTARAQAPAGDGILGEYYEGADFERLVTRRYDATLAFNWGHAPPAPGLGAEYFSVRWTGWLVPPVSGRYVLHVAVDDGMRIWLNDKLVLNEWRPQPVRYFTTSILLKAGEPYKLRVDYFQDILDTSARVTWERPDVPLTPPPSSWRNLWGMTAATPKPEPIPTQFLFRHNPRPSAALAAGTVPAPKPLPKTPVAATATPAAKPLVISSSNRLTATPPRRPFAPPLAVAKPATLVLPATSGTGLLLTDSTGPARLSRLAVGEEVTLPKLYFNQGKAQLLPSSRIALDRLAAALSAQPALRLEVQGHTDNMGNAELNRQLSQQRAEAVCLYLTAHGVNTAQLRPMGYGGTQPVADNADPAQRPRNRRVVLRRL
ncbi:outer membrane protein OmpA-like peptidoglycan-associated protein [Hymenobacter sp. UYAg731]